MMFYILVVAVSMMIGSSACAMVPTERTALVVRGGQIPGGYQASFSVYRQNDQVPSTGGVSRRAPAAPVQAPEAEADENRVADAECRCTDMQVAGGGIVCFAAALCCLFCGGK